MKKAILVVAMSFVSLCLYAQSPNPFPAVPPTSPSPVDSINHQKTVDSLRYRSMNPQDSLYYKRNNTNPMKVPNRSDTIIRYPGNDNNQNPYIHDDRDPKIPK